MMGRCRKETQGKTVKLLECLEANHRIGETIFCQGVCADKQIRSTSPSTSGKSKPRRCGYLSAMSSVGIKNDEELNATRKEILELSKKYIKDLSDHPVQVEDGPAAYSETSYDMKKALAVLIDDLNQRLEDLSNHIEVLETHLPKPDSLDEDTLNQRVEDLSNHIEVLEKHLPKPDSLDEDTLNKRVEDLSNHIEVLEKHLPKPDSLDEDTSKNYLANNKQEICPFPSFKDWPDCEIKLGWMRKMWESDRCYADWGVDGGECTMLVYLSEQEHWCPPFPWRLNMTLDRQETSELAVVRENFTELFEKMDDSFYFKWIKSRIQRMSVRWVEAGKSLSKKLKIAKRKKKRVLFHMGLLADEVSLRIDKNAFSDEPLEELVQWSDLIIAVYILGHDVVLTKSMKDLHEIYIPYLKSASSSCPLKKRPFDMVYSDIKGLKMLNIVADKKFHLLECNLRVLDSFGTEPEFNHLNYASKKSHKSAWGKWNLNPKQFNTMFPHSPDNTFLGFVVEDHLNTSSMHNIKKDNFAVVYGKRDLFWEGKASYLSALHDVLEIHSTVDESTPLANVPNFVHNHGVLPGLELHKLLRRAKIFVGLGFPYEGPAPLEAIANGAVYLNPVFKIPKDSINTLFLKDKPTLRKLTSQHPYAEMFIGPPHVRSVHLEDLDSVKTLVKEVVDSPDKITPYMPYEFSCAGMLERLSLHLEKQDFCPGSIKPIWPPESALQIKITDSVQTCSEICHMNGLVCEPSYFPILNKRATFTSLNITCNEFILASTRTEIDYPAFIHDRCYLQSDTKLFSCAGRYTKMQRLCPCRDYLPGQVALCKDC